jgi:V8-like Glu-specific endopeptidase
MYYNRGNLTSLRLLTRPPQGTAKSIGRNAILATMEGAIGMTLRYKRPGSARKVAPWAAAMLMLMAMSARGADFSTPNAAAFPRALLHRVAVFSDNPEAVHDPRYQQSQTGTDTMFAPIGLIRTNGRVPDDFSPAAASHLHLGTAFLVSPCYVLTDFHVVFGSRTTKPEPDQDHSATFILNKKMIRAVPAAYGEFYRFRGRDWALYSLEPDADHRCLGEDPAVGWVRLAPLDRAAAQDKSLSIAGYPSDRSFSSLWRQDACRLYERQGNIENDGMWTTDCATRPGASGSPIFFVQDGVLNVVAIMSGHIGPTNDREILPKWDANRANLALDIGKIVSSEPEFLRLIALDLDRFARSKVAPAPPASPVEAAASPSAAVPDESISPQ